MTFPCAVHRFHVINILSTTFLVCVVVTFIAGAWYVAAATPHIAVIDAACDRTLSGQSRFCHCALDLLRAVSPDASPEQLLSGVVVVHGRLTTYPHTLVATRNTTYVYANQRKHVSVALPCSLQVSHLEAPETPFYTQCAAGNWSQYCVEAAPAGGDVIFEDSVDLACRTLLEFSTPCAVYVFSDDGTTCDRIKSHGIGVWELLFGGFYNVVACVGALLCIATVLELHKREKDAWITTVISTALTLYLLGWGLIWQNLPCDPFE